jgi:hypothetical protein
MLFSPVLGKTTWTEQGEYAMKTLHFFAALVVALFFVACGGEDPSDNNPTPSPTASPSPSPTVPPEPVACGGDMCAVGFACADPQRSICVDPADTEPDCSWLSWMHEHTFYASENNTGRVPKNTPFKVTIHAHPGLCAVYMDDAEKKPVGAYRFTDGAMLGVVISEDPKSKVLLLPDEGRFRSYTWTQGAIMNDDLTTANVTVTLSQTPWN